ncbi:MAG: hypothetical protein WAM09_01595 [Anaerolineales bacterium]
MKPEIARVLYERSRSDPWQVEDVPCPKHRERSLRAMQERSSRAMQKRYLQAMQDRSVGAILRIE